MNETHKVEFEENKIASNNETLNI